MRRYRFGEGQYRYFRQPFPEPVEQLRQELYPRLLPIARDWHALHRDLDGEKVFPLQVAINLSEPGADHTGGKFLLVEQRPRGAPPP